MISLSTNSRTVSRIDVCTSVRPGVRARRAMTSIFPRRQPPRVRKATSRLVACRGPPQKRVTMTYPPPGNQPDPYQQPRPPVSGQPASGQPSSGQPDPYAQYGQSYPPYSGAPYSGQQPYDPTQQQQYAAPGQQYPAAQPYGP